MKLFKKTYAIRDSDVGASVALLKEVDATRVLRFTGIATKNWAFGFLRLKKRPRE